MDNLPKVLIELEAGYPERRHEFLDAAFKICWIALDWSASQLDQGNLEVAACEMRNVDKSRETISPFLAQIKDSAKRRRFEAELRRMEKALLLLRDQISRFGTPFVKASDSGPFRPEREDLKPRSNSRATTRAVLP